MPLVSSWKLYRKANQLSDPMAYVLTEVMRNTSKRHHDELASKHSLLKARTNHSSNWMRIRVGVDVTAAPQIVIVYHRLRHHGQLPKTQKRAWSVSIGVVPGLTPPGPIGSTDPFDMTHAYTKLADEIINRVYDDATTPSVLGPDASIVIYDHVHPEGAKANGTKPDKDRRTSAIGELGWVAEKRIEKDARWDRIEWKLTVERPIHTDGCIIRGWGRDKEDGFAVDDTHCVRTSIRPV